MRHLILWCWIFCGIGAIPEAHSQGYRIPPDGYRFQFPRDHGSHPEYRIEWWYLTGHLSDSSQADSDPPHFGYQATFFRFARSPQMETSPALVHSDQLFMAHMALSDLKNKQYHYEEKIQKRGWDAYASEAHLHTRNGNWTFIQNVSSDQAFEANLDATIGADIQMRLHLASPTQPVIFGRNGVSLKGADPDARSLYITFPRLKTSGTIHYQGREFQIKGTSWMDHEISSSQLAPDQVGWNWASIHLDDGRSIMVYMMRTTGNSMDPYSSFHVIDNDNTSVHQFDSSDFSWSVDKVWTSPDTKASYPVHSTIHFTPPETAPTSAKSLPNQFVLRSRMPQQEFNSKITNLHYWEGACDVFHPNGQKIGSAYVELTGYGHSLTPYLSPNSY
jgi:predicted secreted hydrolase